MKESGNQESVEDSAWSTVCQYFNTERVMDTIPLAEIQAWQASLMNWKEP